MRTKLLVGCLATLMSASVYAAPDMTQPFTWTTISQSVSATNAADVKTNAYFTSGWVDSIILDFSGNTTAATTCTVAVVTAPDYGTLYSRTIWSKTIVTTDDTVHPRDSAHNTSGTAQTYTDAKIPLVQDKIVVQTYANNTTNVIGVKVLVVTSPNP